jgi:hypothetical protein
MVMTVISIVTAAVSAVAGHIVPKAVAWVVAEYKAVKAKAVADVAAVKADATKVEAEVKKAV